MIPTPALLETPIADVDELIVTFKNADLRLKLAIEKDSEHEIDKFSAIADEAINKMVSIQYTNDDASRRLYKFLLKEFVLDENVNYEMRKQICESIIGEL